MDTVTLKVQLAKLNKVSKDIQDYCMTTEMESALRAFFGTFLGQLDVTRKILIKIINVVENSDKEIYILHDGTITKGKMADLIKQVKNIQSLDLGVSEVRTEEKYNGNN